MLAAARSAGAGAAEDAAEPADQGIGPVEVRRGPEDVEVGTLEHHTDAVLREPRRVRAPDVLDAAAADDPPGLDLPPLARRAGDGEHDRRAPGTEVDDLAAALDVPSRFRRA
jgi:hypothetical protein